MNEPRSGHPPEDDHSGIDIDIQSVDYLKKIVQHFMDRKKQAFPPNLADDMLRDVISWNHRERTLSFRKNDNQGHVSSYPEEVYLGRRFLLLSDAGLDVMYSLLAYVSATRLEDSEVLKKRREMRNAFTPLLTRASRCYWEAFQSQPVSTIHDHPNQRVLPPPRPASASSSSDAHFTVVSAWRTCDGSTSTPDRPRYQFVLPRGMHQDVTMADWYSCRQGRRRKSFLRTLVRPCRSRIS